MNPQCFYLTKVILGFKLKTAVKHKKKTKVNVRESETPQ